MNATSDYSGKYCYYFILDLECHFLAHSAYTISKLLVTNILVGTVNANIILCTTVERFIIYVKT